jgi:hypothetical protein
MHFGNLRRSLPAVSASLLALVLSLIAAATAFADGGGVVYPH